MNNLLRKHNAARKKKLIINDLLTESTNKKEETVKLFALRPTIPRLRIIERPNILRRKSNEHIHTHRKSNEQPT